MALREILIELGIDVDDEGAERAIDGVRRGLRRMAAAEEQSRGGLRGLASRLGTVRNFAVGLGAAFLTGKLAQGFASMITSAGDAAEVANKFGAVFVEETDRVGAAMEDMANRTGQSTIAIQEMAADAGALVKPLVGSTAAAADLARTMTAAALDISSFENVLPKDALGAIRSAIIGSSEPMLRFGVDTRQAALAQFALDKGLNKSIKSMSTAEVTALRMELIMQRLGDKGAVGDAEKTAGSFTNRLRGLQGAFDDLVAELGAEFLPMATEFLGWLLAFTKENGPKFVKAMNGVVTVVTLFRDVIVSLVTPLTDLNNVLLIISTVGLAKLALAFNTAGVAGVVAAVKAAAAWVVATLPMLIFIGLIAILVVFVALLIQDFKRMGDGADSVSGTMVKGFQDLVKELGGIGPAILEMLNVAIDHWIKFFEDVTGLSLASVDEVVEFWESSFFALFDGIGVLFDLFIGDSIKKLMAVGKAISGLFGDGKEIAVVASGIAATGGQGSAIPTGGPIRSRATSEAPGGVGGTTILSQPNNTTTVQVDASGQSNPGAIGEAVATAMGAEFERRDRRTHQRFRTALAGT